MRVALPTDSDRFDRLWRDHHRSVARFIARRLPSYDDGSEVVSDVFLTAWRRLDELPSDSAAALPWLYGVAHKTVANRLRGSRRQLALQARLRSEPEAAGRQLGPQGDEPGPDTLALVSSFNHLGVADREAIALVTWDGLTPQEAGKVLGISAARFRVRLHRAKQRLRDGVAESPIGSRPTQSDRQAQSSSQPREAS